MRNAFLLIPKGLITSQNYLLELLMVKLWSHVEVLILDGIQSFNHRDITLHMLNWTMA